MKIEIKPHGETFKQVRRRLAALPVGCQADVYGEGFIAAARKSRLKSKRLCPVGTAEPRTRAGNPRRRLRDSIRAVRVGWKWDGVRVPKSAAIVVAEQPHAHLVEKGTVRTRKHPFLAPPLKDGGGLNEAFRTGCAKSFVRLVNRLESSRLRARERRAFRTGG